MSRTVHLKLEAAEIEAICTRKNIAISVIEALLSGGTRVVLRTSDGAAEMRRLAKSSLIDGPVRRFPGSSLRG